MVRDPLSTSDHERGERLGAALRAARGERTIVEIADRAGISAETLRKIERGRTPTPAFFTVADVARVLGLSLDDLVAGVAQDASASAQVAPEVARDAAIVARGGDGTRTVHDLPAVMATLGR